MVKYRRRVAVPARSVLGRDRLFPSPDFGLGGVAPQRRDQQPRGTVQQLAECQPGKGKKNRRQQSVSADAGQPCRGNDGCSRNGGKGRADHVQAGLSPPQREREQDQRERPELQGVECDGSHRNTEDVVHGREGGAQQQQSAQGAVVRQREGRLAYTHSRR